MASEPESELVVSAVWWDPKDRKMIFDPSSVVAGLLVASRRAMTFAQPPDEVVFEAGLDELTLKWLGARTALQIEGLSRPYRLFFAPPVNGVPKLSESKAGKLAETVATSAKAGQLFGFGGAALGAASQFGELLSIAFDGLAFLDGRRNYNKLKQYLQTD